jgi:hypothetical protein
MAHEARARPATRAHPNPEALRSEIQPQPDAAAIPVAESRDTRTAAQWWDRLQSTEARLLLKLALLMTGLWVLAVGTGALLNNGIPPVREKLPLVWFDRLLRSIGPLLPAPVLLLRWYGMLPPAGSGADGGPGLAQLLVLYAAVAAARLGLYSLHLLLAPLILAVRDEGSHAHLVSDHIFLGAALVAIFTAEAHLLAADVRRRWSSRRRLDRAVLAAAGALLALLFGLVCVEMHVTARHFHAPPETFWAVATGLVFFQVPVALFLLRVGP